MSFQESHNTSVNEAFGGAKLTTKWIMKTYFKMVVSIIRFKIIVN